MAIRIHLSLTFPRIARRSLWTLFTVTYSRGFSQEKQVFLVCVESVAVINGGCVLKESFFFVRMLEYRIDIEAIIGGGKGYLWILKI